MEIKFSRVAQLSQQVLLPPGVLAGKIAEKQKNNENKQTNKTKKNNKV